MNIAIPQKSSFTFNEVCSITGVKPYVLRFWESEFSQVDPVMGDNGEKIYDLTDLHAVIKIKDLLFEEKLSIPNAKFKLMEQSQDFEDVVRPEDQVSSSYVEERKPSFVFEPPESDVSSHVSNENEIIDTDKLNLAKEVLLSAKSTIQDLKLQMNW